MLTYDTENITLPSTALYRVPPNYMHLWPKFGHSRIKGWQLKRTDDGHPQFGHPTTREVMLLEIDIFIYIFFAIIILPIYML